jgi:hypothetical protein
MRWAAVVVLVLASPTAWAGDWGLLGPGYGYGYQGFGLGYHLGYGYGGHALGVGPYGGYPKYGGPGYPVITPFNTFRPAGPLVVNEPVVREGNDSPLNYGCYTGVIPYPESLFAPYVDAAARGEMTRPGGGGRAGR